MKLTETVSCPQKGGILWRKLTETVSCPQNGGVLWRKQIWKQEPGCVVIKERDQSGFICSRCS